MTNPKISTFRIVRRAFSQFTEVDVIETTWTAAQLIAMLMEAYNGDGEYMLRDVGEADYRAPATCPVQAAWAYL